MNTNNKISDIIFSQAPDFVKNDYETFIAFLESYYQFLEQYSATLNTGNVVERTKNLLTYIDIDSSIDDFIQKYYNEFLSLLTTDVLVDKVLLLKHAKDFYRSKGSEKSLKFLLRIINGLDSEIIYPKRYILKLSDSTWYIQKTLRITNFEIDGVPTTNLLDYQNIVGTSIKGNTSNSTAIVERIDRFFENGSKVDEITLNNIKGNFSQGEQIFSNYIDINSNLRNITANIISGIITFITITNSGYNYKIGDVLEIIPKDQGHGANAIVSSVTVGNITSIAIKNSGAGFLANDNFLITGGGGTGANAYVSSVNTDEYYHPNSYNIIIDLISYEANTPINNTVYSNLNISNANTTLDQAFHNMVYGPTGPMNTIVLVSGGVGYSAPPSFNVIANTRIKEIGILGKMKINQGGLNYSIGDIIRFSANNGFGANAAVTNVDSNGTITKINFTPNAGFLIGGMGYSQTDLPKATVNSVNGTGASISVNAVLGSGDSVSLGVSNIGSIQAITILSGGQDYTIAPTISLSNTGSGTAQAEATIITGIYTYPGRYLDDTGHLSSYYFLQNEDYYQNYSYVIRIQDSLNKYRKALRDILHPAGLKLFGNYLLETFSTENTISSNTNTIIFRLGTYSYDNTSNLVYITRTDHGINANNEVYLEFISGDTNNVSNSFYNVKSVMNANTFDVSINLGISVANTSGDVKFGLLT